MKTTRYFEEQVLRKRPYIRREWCIQVVQAPLRRETWLPALPPPFDRWTMARPFPAFRADFRAWWKKRKRQ